MPANASLNRSLPVNIDTHITVVKCDLGRKTAIAVCLLDIQIPSNLKR